MMAGPKKRWIRCNSTGLACHWRQYEDGVQCMNCGRTPVRGEVVKFDTHHSNNGSLSTHPYYCVQGGVHRFDDVIDKQTRKLTKRCVNCAYWRYPDAEGN